MTKTLSYVLITPARNEARFIESTIKSVVAQTIKPLKWVIVSDGSTDGTDEIVTRYSASYPWIELVRMPEHRSRDFAGKVYAFNAGYERIKDLRYDAIANVDGDISFDEEYFTFLLEKLAGDPTLGVVGTAFRDHSSNGYDYRFVSIEHVTGCCQMFRRECFDAIGGYVPSRGGAVDSIAVITARMRGWKTKTFTEKTYSHHRVFGTAQNGEWRASFKNGRKDYIVGNHPVWECFRILHQMTKKPFIIGGLALGCGYLWALLRNEKRPVSSELVSFYRKEQMNRLHQFFTTHFRPVSLSSHRAH